jgi:hypothetical protein
MTVSSFLGLYLGFIVIARRAIGRNAMLKAAAVESRCVCVRACLWVCGWVWVWVGVRVGVHADQLLRSASNEL